MSETIELQFCYRRSYSFRHVHRSPGLGGERASGLRWVDLASMILITGSLWLNMGVLRTQNFESENETFFSE